MMKKNILNENFEISSNGYRQPNQDYSLWYDLRFRAGLFQVLILSSIIVGAYLLFTTTLHNLETRGITSGFGFLQRAAGFDISFSLIEYTSESSNGRVFIVGLLNTLLVSALGIIFATIIGVLVGVARLSSNWIVTKLATIYIELFRNIPLLLQIFFWYFAVLSSLPSIREVMKSGGWLDGTIFFSNRGLTVPKPLWGDGSGLLLVAAGIALMAVFSYGQYAKKKQASTGQQSPVGIISLVIFSILIGGAFMLADKPLSFEYPEASRFNLRGGLTIIPEFMALLFALSIYTGAFIAEIVRAGINSVSHGQTEAAHSLAISPRLTLKLVVIPQALRVIIPPLASQYLNLAKNSSLAAAIAYPELVSVFTGTTLNNTGQALECVLLTMLAYLIISLSISAFMNWYNKRIALVER